MGIISELFEKKEENNENYALELVIPRHLWRPKMVETSRGRVAVFWFNVSLKNQN